MISSLIGFRSRVVLQGTYYCDILGELGEDMYEELCQDDALVLETVFYCQEELGSVGKALQASRKLLSPHFDETKQKKRLINHDFLMLRVQPGQPDEPAFHIKAVKVPGSGDGKAKHGIHISVHEHLDKEDMERRCCLHRIDCGTRIGLGDLIAILKRKSPDYDARDENCWDYARKTTKWLLEECIEVLTNCDDCEQMKSLKTELDQLEANLVKKHAVNTVERVVKYAETRVWD